MINLIMFETTDELESLTGLNRDQLWDAGFNLDDFDVGFCSDNKLDEYSWLCMQMAGCCVGYVHTEHNGKHYYTVHHA